MLVFCPNVIICKKIERNEECMACRPAAAIIMHVVYGFSELFSPLFSRTVVAGGSHGYYPEWPINY